MAVLAVLVFTNCSGTKTKVEPRVKKADAVKAMSADLVELPAALKYPNAIEIDQSGESSDAGINRFYIFQTDDSLPVVEKFYRQAITGLWEGVGFSTSRGEKAIVISAEDVDEGENSGNEGVFCTLIRDAQGTIGTLIYWQRSKPQTKL